METHYPTKYARVTSQARKQNAHQPHPTNLNFGFRNKKMLPNKTNRKNFNTLDENCQIAGNYRRCENGECIPGIDLCPEEQLMNQNTILIMIVVGLAVVIFLIVLYCFQQRQRARPRRHRSRTNEETDEDSADRISLFLPPPTYEEVVTTNLYPPTPVMQIRQNQLNSFDEPTPLTPPPNYSAALAILARSHESIFNQKLAVPRRQSSSHLTRRSVSVDHLSSRSQSQTQNVTQNLDPPEFLEDDVFVRNGKENVLEERR